MSMRCYCLLLNASFEPLKIISWRRALILFFQEKVEVIEYHNQFARSAHQIHSIPSILKLRSYLQFRLSHKVRFCRENVYLRDQFECQYCGSKKPPREMTLDHVLPVSRRGSHNWTNVVTACRSCNQKKGNRTPMEAKMPLRKKPIEPKWLPNQNFIELKKLPDSWRAFLVTVGIEVPDQEELSVASIGLR
jgi:5-methylcytosine-specific restriction endonuclease McrA